MKITVCLSEEQYRLLTLHPKEQLSEAQFMSLMEAVRQGACVRANCRRWVDKRNCGLADEDNPYNTCYCFMPYAGGD